MSRNKTLILMFFFTYLCGFAFGSEDFIYNAEGKRDPFIPLVSKEGRLISLDRHDQGRPSDLSVNGIIYDKQGISYAIVNGLVVGIGDYVGEYRVLKIEEGRLFLIKGDQIREMTISKEDDK